MKIFALIFISSFIGWITNYIAIKMLFRPKKEINLFFFKLQGLIPKRKDEIAKNISELINKELISINDILNDLNSDELNQALEDKIDMILDEKLVDNIKKAYPMLSMFISDSILENLKIIIKDSILENKGEIFKIISDSIEKKVNFSNIIEQKIKDFSLDKLEEVIFYLAKKELKHIEILGAILGAIIGFIQYFVFIFI